MNDDAFATTMGWFGLMAGVVGLIIIFVAGYPEISSRLVAMGVLP